MSIDEAIKHCEEVAEEKRESCVECAKEHLQLAEWLKDYKRLLEQEPCTDAISREDALMALTGKYTESPIEILPKAIRRIKTLPPVKPAEKCGEVLDKIRAEIDSYCSDNRDRNDGLYIAMRIIDKYKASPTGAEEVEE